MTSTSPLIALPRRSPAHRLIDFFAAILSRNIPLHDSSRIALFNDINNRYGDMISRICYGYATSHDEMQDLRQDVYVNIWQGLDRFSQHSSLKTWVYRVALNTCVSSLRSRSRRGQKVSLDFIADTSEDSQDQRELITSLYHSIESLAPLDKAIVMMWLDGMAYEEIAETTGMGRNTVATRLRRAKEKIKNNLNY